MVAALPRAISFCEEEMRSEEQCAKQEAMFGAVVDLFLFSVVDVSSCSRLFVVQGATN